MSDHPPQSKKQRLNNNNDGENRFDGHVDTGSCKFETTRAPTSAVTALALLSDTIVFSGHRDGSICRWNLISNPPVSEDPQQQQPPPPRRQLPDWVITTACLNLTNHELYKNEEKLGIAGLVVRKNQASPNDDKSTTSVSSSTRTATSAVATHFLYSWNHQREDMRMEINEIGRAHV